MVLLAYDIECYKNLFTITFLDVFSDKKLIDAYISIDKSNKENKGKLKAELIEMLGVRKFVITPDDVSGLHALHYYLTSEWRTLVGYNNKNYDDTFLDYIINTYTKTSSNGRYKGKTINENLYNLSQEIIMGVDGHPKYIWDEFRFKDKNFDSYDIMSIVYEKNSRKSLKQTAINLKWHRIQDLPIPYYEDVDLSNIYKVLDYNFNDVLITRELVLHKKEELLLRVTGSNLWDVDLSNSNRSSCADRIVSKLYCDETGLKYRDIKDLRTYRKIINFSDIISEKIKFKTKYFQDFLLDLKLDRYELNTGQEFVRNLLVDGVGYTFKLGGLHTVDKSLIIESNKDFKIYDADISSFYPRIVLNEKVCPAHLDVDIFQSLYAGIVDRRLTAKHLGIKDESEMLKIVINSVFGKFIFGDSWLYDPKAGYTVTINGQLYILTLAERLIMAGFRVISANTDGVTAVIPTDRIDEYKAICAEWEKDFDFELEIVEYVKIVRRDVNCYSAKYANGKMKYKGDLNPNIDISKGYDKPIIAIAIDNYFYRGIPLEKTIREHTNIYDFCMSQKTGDDFITEEHKLNLETGKLEITELQKNNRYFISKTGVSLQKKYKEKNKRISLMSGKYVTVYNDAYDTSNFNDYNVDYNYYISKATNYYYLLTNQTTKSMNKNSNNGLFDFNM